MNAPDPLERLVQNVLSSSKYRSIDPRFIRQIAAQELGKRRDWKEALKATKNKLHQVGGAYLEVIPPYARWQIQLEQLDTSSAGPELRAEVRKMLAQHASTRERLPILDTFYAVTLAELAPIRSVLDLACGLNPLSIPWMPLAPQAEYYACDIYTDLVDFLNHYFGQMRIQGRAETCDLTRSVPQQPVQLALLLKSLPCLEQVDRNISLPLLDAVQAEHLLVSFPAYSLGGRAKGMSENYASRFQEILAARSWPYQQYEFSTELAFLVHKAARTL